MSNAPPKRRDVAAWAVLVAAASRSIMDLLWAVEVPGVGNLTRAATLLACLVFAGFAVAHARTLWRHPLRVPVGLWAALLVLGTLRAPDLGEGLAGLVRYGSGLLVLAATSALPASHARRIPTVFLAAGLVPIVCTLLTLGDPTAWLVLHDEARLLGPYQVLHAHALAMGTLVGLGAATAWLRTGWERWLGVTVAALAVVPLVLSATRSGLVLAGLVVFGVLLAQRRYRAVAAGLLALVLLVVALPPLRHRFSELGWALVGVAPEQGWGWLGTGRVAIWTRSFSAFRELPAVDQVLGTGLGGFTAFWKGKEPHNEYLAALYQLGPLGVVAMVATLVAALRSSFAQSRPEARLAFAMTLAIAGCSAIGSTFLVRLTLSWAFWAVLGAFFATRRQEENF